jgi:hypothetical protein
MGDAGLTALGGIVTDLLQMFLGPGIARAQTLKTQQDMYGNMPSAMNLMTSLAPPGGIRSYVQGNKVLYEPPLYPSTSQYWTGIRDQNPSMYDPTTYAMNALNRRRQTTQYTPRSGTQGENLLGMFMP